jgi:hypothetical protein
VEPGALVLDLEEKLRLGLGMIEGGGGGNVDVTGAGRGEEAAGERVWKEEKVHTRKKDAFGQKKEACGHSFLRLGMWVVVRSKNELYINAFNNSI